jgi:hypothetical protein
VEVLLGVLTGDSVLVGVAVSVGVPVGVTVRVCVAVDVGVTVAEGVAVGVALGVIEAVSVAVTVTVNVDVDVSVLVSVALGLALDVAVGLAVGVWVGVAVKAFTAQRKKLPSNPAWAACGPEAPAAPPITVAVPEKLSLTVAQRLMRPPPPFVAFSQTHHCALGSVLPHKKTPLRTVGTGWRRDTRKCLINLMMLRVLGSSVRISQPRHLQACDRRDVHGP